MTQNDRVGPVVKGGELPVLADSAARSRAFAEQRRALAFQQQQESGRAALASQTDLTTTAMRNRSNEVIAAMQVRGANNRAAMQNAAEDQRQAKELLNNEENRKFQAQQSIDHQKFVAAESERERVFTAAQGDKTWERQKELAKNEMDMFMNMVRLNTTKGMADSAAAYGLAGLYAKSATTQTRLQIDAENKAAMADQEREQIRKASEDIALSAQNNSDKDVHKWANEQLNLLKTPVASLDYLTLRGYTGLEDAIRSGEIGKADLAKLSVFVDTVRKSIADSMPSEKEIDDLKVEELAMRNDITYFQHFLTNGGKEPERRAKEKTITKMVGDRADKLSLFKKLNEASMVLDKLQTSSNQYVRSVATEAWKYRYGMSSAATTKQAMDMMGGVFNLQGIADIYKNAYKNMTSGKYTGQYADFFRGQESMLRNSANIMEPNSMGVK